MITIDGDADHLSKLERILDEQGVVALLRQLNARTPFRFTGIYRYDPPTLRNVHLIDAFAPDVTTGSDVAMVDAYCVLVGPERPSLEFTDASCDARFLPRSGSPVVSYCGVSLTTTDGVPFGTVCHFDVERCEKNGTELGFLQTLSRRIMDRLASEHPHIVPTARPGAGSLAGAPTP